jgi:hypothetical protein
MSPQRRGLDTSHLRGTMLLCGGECSANVAPEAWLRYLVLALGRISLPSLLIIIILPIKP